MRVQICTATDKQAVATCFSPECAHSNGNRPTRLCQTCHTHLHMQSAPAPSGTLASGNAMINAFKGAKASTATALFHIVQTTMPDISDYDATVHQFLTDAIVGYSLLIRPTQTLFF